jgi:hypothetical protein
MKIAFKMGALTALLTFAAGCVVHHRHAGHYPPPQPAPKPRVVVVTPPEPPPVVVTPPRRPQPPVVVVAPPREPEPPVVVVTSKPGRPPQRSPGTSRPAREPWVNVTITTHERQVIREYVVVHSDKGKHGKKGKEKSLPPGLAKKVARGGSLPPGWQKKLARGEIMSAEVYRQCDPLPDEVIVRLPSPPAGTILVTIDGKVVRLARATLEILDVFDVHI